jgi:hypothetical protein
VVGGGGREIGDWGYDTVLQGEVKGGRVAHASDGDEMGGLGDGGLGGGFDRRG